MLERYEQKVALDWIANLIPLSTHSSTWAKVVDGLVDRLADELGLDTVENTPFGSGSRRRRPSRMAARLRVLDKAEIPEERWDAICSGVEQHREALRRARPGMTERNLRSVARRFELDRHDAALLSLLVRKHTGSPFEDIVDAARGGWLGSQAQFRRALAVLLGLPAAEVSRRLLPDGRLAQSGLIELDRSGNPEIVDQVGRAISTSPDRATLTGQLLPPVVRPSLDLGQFTHVGPDLDRIQRILSGALAEGTRGVHILLYGSPGTGKTELCKTIAAAVGADLHSVGECDEDGNEPSRRERIAAYRLAQRLLERNRQALILFDEAEDMFEPEGSSFFARLLGGHRSGQSKAFIHRMLEESPVPTLWTTNEIEPMGVPVLRRMTCTVHVGKPPAAVRHRIWTDALDEVGIPAAKEEIRALAEDFEEAPALAAAAARSARLAGGGIAEVRAAMDGMCTAIRGGIPSPPKARLVAVFDPELIAADTDILAIEAALAGSPAGNAPSFCLYGPPGTGKSAWVRHLAARMNRDVLHLRASDLIDPFVGMTERRIARAFADARSSGRFLIFDEADTFLSDRTGARHSWEVSAVNEMLTWMEVHDQPFACTTNLMSRLDPASLRRFTFRIRFGYLSPGQADKAFRSFFHLEPPSGLPQLELLTPGDFAVVARRARIIGQDRDAGMLLAMLEQECAAKPDHRQRIGFGT